MDGSRDEITREIRRELQRDVTPQELSERLFACDGLFARLAPTREERIALVGTELFRDAQQRLSDLQDGALGRFKQALTETPRRGGEPVAR